MYIHAQTNLVPLKPAFYLLLGLLTAGLAGCSTTSHYKGDTAADSFRAAAAEVQAQSQTLVLAMDTLKNLVATPTADLKPSFQQFNYALDRFTASATRVENIGRRVEQKHAAYIQAWENQLGAIDYQHIRDLSLARHAEVTNRFEAVHHRFQQSQAVVQPLIIYLTDIRKALSADLTAAGLDSMKPIVQNADQNAAKVQVALAALERELTSSGAQLSSTLPQPQTAETPGSESPRQEKARASAPRAQARTQ